MSLISTTTDRRVILNELVRDFQESLARLIASAEDQHEGYSFARICEWDSFYRETAAWYDTAIAAARSELRYL